MDWQTLRNQFIREIGGDLPGGHLEQQLIDAYTEHPTAVERAIEKITLGHQAGKVRSPWGALKTEVERAVHTANNPTHQQGHNREKAVQRAEQWIRHAGLHYDRWDEIHDELYGDRGKLRDHPATEPRMRELWHDLRPLGEQVEREQIERLARHAEQRKTLADKLPKTEQAA